MINWIKALFSNTNNAETIVKKGSEIIDEAFYTDQEKAEEKSKLMEFYFKLLESTQYMSIARRVIAFIFVLEYILLINVCVIGMIIGASWIELLSSSIKEWALWPVNIIVGFYFFQAIVKTGNGKK